VLTAHELAALKRNFVAYSQDVLTPRSFEHWHPILVRVIDQAKLCADIAESVRIEGFKDATPGCPLDATKCPYYGDGCDNCRSS